MPKMEMSICRNSARAGKARLSAKHHRAVIRRISNPFPLEEQSEIERYANAFARIEGGAILINRELHAARDRVVLVYAKRRRPDEHLIRATARPLAHPLAEDTPVPSMILPPTLRTIRIRE